MKLTLSFLMSKIKVHILICFVKIEISGVID